MKTIDGILKELSELTDNDIDRIFSEHHARMSFRSGGNDEEPSPHRWRIAALRDAYTRYTADADPLAPGDIVLWKSGLRNRGLPKYGEPAIVMETFDHAVEKMIEHGGQAIGIDLIDTVIGAYDDDGDFLMACTDSQRLERWTRESV